MTTEGMQQPAKYGVAGGWQKSTHTGANGDCVEVRPVRRAEVDKSAR